MNNSIALSILLKFGIAIPDRKSIIRSMLEYAIMMSFVDVLKKGLVVGKVDREVAQKRREASRKRTSSTRTRKGRLSTADTKRFKQVLLEKRREIVGNVNEMRDEALKKSRLDASGDLSSMPIHMADIGTDNYEQEFALGLMDSERKLLKEIDDALRRIEQRVYGICEATGKPIGKARLEARPWARYCVEYARMLEQGLVTEPEQSVSKPREYESEDELEEALGG